MAAKKKKSAKQTKRAPKKTKRAVKKAAPARRKSAARKAAPKKKTKRAAKPKKAQSRQLGEGNYKASRRFRKKEESFVKHNRKKIPALAKAAEAALEGPEGADLRAAEVTASAHAAGQS